MFQGWIAFLLTASVTATRRIVDGETSQRFEYPWVTSIQVMTEHRCGGVLIDEVTMITAAHCSHHPITPLLRVIAHRHNLLVPTLLERSLKFSVETIFIHPAYNGTIHISNDFAIWKLNLIQGDRKDIPSGVVELHDGIDTPRRLKIAGWGVSSIPGHVPMRQKKGQVIQVPDNECRRRYPHLGPSEICALGMNDHLDTTCYGDSGGPLFYEQDSKVILVGITSYTTRCGDYGDPNVYAKVSSALDWIKSKI